MTDAAGSSSDRVPAGRGSAQLGGAAEAEGWLVQRTAGEGTGSSGTGSGTRSAAPLLVLSAGLIAPWRSAGTVAAGEEDWD